jgi:hypothetical protein
MPWKYNNVIISAGQSWTDSNGITHSKQWTSWSDAEKTAAGMVYEAPPTVYDDRFYWDDGTAKSLTDVNEVDDNNDPILDQDGNQIVTEGLKTIWKRITKERAATRLAKYDWYVVRKSEDSTATIPSNVATYRSNVRSSSNTIETAIDNAADHAAFMALWDEPDGGGKAPIDNWPDEI